MIDTVNERRAILKVMPVPGTGPSTFTRRMYLKVYPVLAGWGGRINGVMRELISSITAVPFETVQKINGVS